MDVYNIGYLYLAQRHIYLYLGKTYAGCKGVCLAVAGCLCRDMDGTVQAVKCRGSQFFHGKKRFPCVLIHHEIVLYIQCVLAALKHISAVLQYLFLKYGSGLLDCHAAYICLPGCIGPCVKGRYIRILRGQDIDLVCCYPRHLCRHLGKHRVGTLSDFGCAHGKLHGAVLVQYHPAGRCFQGNGIYACLVTENGHSDSLSYGTCLVLIFPALLVPVNEPAALFHTFHKAVSVAFHMGVGVLISRPHTVLPAELQRIHMKGQGQVIRHTLRCKGCLGDPVSSHGAACGNIGVYRIGIGLQNLFIMIYLLELIG